MWGFLIAIARFFFPLAPDFDELSRAVRRGEGEGKIGIVFQKSN
jgi:hypothetical protein